MIQHLQKFKPTTFSNMVCKGKTDLSPTDLLRFVKQIENKIGRKTGPINSPAPSISIYLLHKLSWKHRYWLFLTLPNRKSFVLAPLADIAQPSNIR
jgi:7,8-dihydro-6-hydroxymethylpterin-pyrophosphokinase